MKHRGGVGGDGEEDKTGDNKNGGEAGREK